MSSSPPPAADLVAVTRTVARRRDHEIAASRFSVLPFAEVAGVTTDADNPTVRALEVPVIQA